MKIWHKSIHASIILALLVTLMCYLKMEPLTLTAQASSPTLKIGDYIRFGTYNGEPILWRIIQLDSSGHPILFADRILTYKAFDAAGSYFTYNRAFFGSHYYPDSNLRQWLNSSSPNAGSDRIDWLQNDPTGSNLYESDNPYSSERGFLADGNFTPMERSFLKPLQHQVLLSQGDSANKDGRTSEPLNDINGLYQLNDFKYVTDRVFLLSIKQLKEFIFDRKWSITAYPTAQAVQNSTYRNSNYVSVSQTDEYWLSTPFLGSAYHVRVAQGNGLIDYTQANNGRTGVRPAVQLNRADTLFLPGGNGTAGNPYVVKRADTSPPSAPTGLTEGNVTTGSVIFRWLPSSDDTGVTGYDVYVGSTLYMSVSGSSFSIQVSGLEQGKTYTFSVRAKDAAGNLSALSNGLTVTTLIPQDLQAPSSPTGLTATNVTNVSVKLNWSASSDDIAVTGYEVYRDDVLISTVSGSNLTYSNNGLTPKTTYVYKVRAKDASGKFSDFSSSVTVTTPEVLPGFKIHFKKPANWSTPSIYFYNQQPAYVQGVTWATAPVMQLESGDWYVYHLVGVTRAVVMFKDSNGKQIPSAQMPGFSVSKEGWFNGSTWSDVDPATIPLDTQAPTAPANVTSTNTTTSSTTLLWSSATDNIGIEGYDIYNGSVLVGTVPAALSSFTVNGLRPGMSFDFSIKARDAAGNLSLPSTVLRVQTTGIIDVVGKTITVNGSRLNLGAGIEPVTINGTIMVPFRAIFETLGLGVNFNPSTRAIEATKSGYRLRLQLNSRTASVNGFINKTMPLAPSAIRGTTMVPLRFIGEELGLKVTFRAR